MQSKILNEKISFGRKSLMAAKKVRDKNRSYFKNFAHILKISSTKYRIF